MKYESLNTTELRDGMILNCHGALYRLTDGHLSRAHADGQTYAFTGEYLGLAPGYDYCSIPEAWRENWTIQGNHLARWAVVVQEDLTDGDLYEFDRPCLVKLDGNVLVQSRMIALNRRTVKVRGRVADSFNVDRADVLAL